ncbi:hypothetical protein PM082_014987 [Marasmius tenuissimus]|nr:hypothetical protein PM082_014987 [Marasmius tenuissimus]
MVSVCLATLVGLLVTPCMGFEITTPDPTFSGFEIAISWTGVAGDFNQTGPNSDFLGGILFEDIEGLVCPQGVFGSSEIDIVEDSDVSHKGSPNSTGKFSGQFFFDVALSRPYILCVYENFPEKKREDLTEIYGANCIFTSNPFTLTKISSSGMGRRRTSTAELPTLHWSATPTPTPIQIDNPHQRTGNIVIGATVGSILSTLAILLGWLTWRRQRSNKLKALKRLDFGISPYPRPSMIIVADRQPQKEFGHRDPNPNPGNSPSQARVERDANNQAQVSRRVSVASNREGILRHVDSGWRPSERLSAGGVERPIVELPPTYSEAR